MISLVVVPPVNDEELLGRAVVTRTQANSCRRGTVLASVFSYPGNFKLSVDRIDKMTSDDEAVRHGEHIASLRGDNRSFYGWALLTKPKVLAEGCECRSSPVPDNFWHADILMPEDAAHDPGMHEVHAAGLARRSWWRDRPDALLDPVANGQ